MALARQYIEKDFYTEEEYLTWEQDAVEKSGYVDGQILAMSGGSEPHAGIPVNIGGELRTALRGRGCRVLSSDMKVWTAGAFYYPDLSVVCGPSQYWGRNRHTITNPIAVVEVLSPSTEAKDRGEKFIRYQQIETLRTYLLVSQTEPLVELFSRGENGHWDYQAVAGMESMIAIPSLEITLALSEVYDQAGFSDAMNEQ
ncbi:MAG: Uma2 family endonuclease [Janthinobacterium lividum]